MANELSRGVGIGRLSSVGGADVSLSLSRGGTSSWLDEDDEAEEAGPTDTARWSARVVPTASFLDADGWAVPESSSAARFRLGVVVVGVEAVAGGGGGGCGLLLVGVRPREGVCVCVDWVRAGAGDFALLALAGSVVFFGVAMSANSGKLVAACCCCCCLCCCGGSLPALLNSTLFRLDPPPTLGLGGSANPLAGEGTGPTDAARSFVGEGMRDGGRRVEDVDAAREEGGRGAGGAEEVGTEEVLEAKMLGARAVEVEVMVLDAKMFVVAVVVVVVLGGRMTGRGGGDCDGGGRRWPRSMMGWDPNDRRGAGAGAEADGRGDLVGCC